jgi:hypothetical protein
MTLRPEQIKAQTYLRDKGSLLPTLEVRARVAAAFSLLEAEIAKVSGEEARRRSAPGEWCVQEVVDHLIVTHRPSIGELHDLLAGRRPAGAPIPAGLQSDDPLGRPWEDLRRDLAAVHAEVLDVLDRAPEGPPGHARAPIVMVVNVREADGREAPLHWIEELDWKAYAIIFRLHTLDHLNQARKSLAALRAGQPALPR